MIKLNQRKNSKSMKKNSLKHLMKWTALAALLLQAGCASFTLKSVPDNATLFEDGEEIAHTPYTFKIFSEERNFIARKVGYVQKEVVVSPFDRSIIYVHLEEVRETTVHSSPMGGVVTDTATGKVIGTTPFEFYTDRPIEASISLPGYKTVVATIEPNHIHRIHLTPEEGFRNITFTSNPDGASIFQRSVGDVIAQTPFTLAVEEGTEFEFMADGYHPQTLLITKRSPETVHVELERIHYVTVESFGGAEVYSAGGGELLGGVPYKTIIDADRIFEVQKEGYYPATVAVSEKSPETITVDLKKLPYKTIDSIPSGATVYRLGRHEKLGTCPLKLLVESDRILEVVKEGYQSSALSLGADSKESITVELKKIPEVPRDDIVVEGILPSDVDVF